CHRLAARCYSLHTIASLVTRERRPRVWSVRPRTVANVDSLGWVVRMGPQGSAGKSSNANNTARSCARHAGAFGYLASSGGGNKTNGTAAPVTAGGTPQ